MSFSKLLILRRRESLKKNIENVMRDANLDLLPPYLKNKILFEVDSKDFDFESILQKIKTDYMYASFFAKDPIKQNIAENLQLEILSSTYKNIIKLPNNGKDAIYIINGQVVKNIEKKSFDFPKSIDFYDIDTNTYFFCKYTKEMGGAQDNQYEDVKRFIKELKDPKDDYTVICLLDGPYYTDKKINDLLRMIQNDKIFIKNSDEFLKHTL